MQRIARQRRARFGAQISDGELDGGRDTAPGRKSARRDGRFAALEFVTWLHDLLGLMTESFRRRACGEVMVWDVNAGNPAAMTRSMTYGGEKASSALPEAAACAAYDTVQEPLGVHAFGEPIGTRLQRQDI